MLHFLFSQQSIIFNSVADIHSFREVHKMEQINSFKENGDVSLTPQELRELCAAVSIAENEKESEEDICTPHELRAIVENASVDFLPKISKDRYNNTYRTFTNWRKSKNAAVVTENVLLAYFIGVAERLKPSTLWSIYSMLKTTLKINENLDIAKYLKLTAFLKRKTDGFQAKKSKILSSENVEKFLSEAPEEIYLATKVNKKNIYILQLNCNTYCICRSL